MMNFEKLVRLIQEVVEADGTWKEKRDAILNESDETERSAILEFAAWFEEEDKSEQD